MLLNKKNLAIAALASKAKSRYTISGIHVTKNGTEVTDGKIAVRVSVPSGTSFQAKNFPMIDGLTDVEQPDFILPADTAQRIAIAIPKEKYISVLNCAQIGETSTGKLSIGITDLDTAQTFQPRKLEGQFPDTKSVWPADDKKGMTITVDADLLASVLKQLIAFDGGRVSESNNGHAAKLTFYDNASAFRIQAACNETGQTFDAIQMPAMAETRQKAPAPAQTPAQPAGKRTEQDIPA